MNNTEMFMSFCKLAGVDLEKEAVSVASMRKAVKHLPGKVLLTGAVGAHLIKKKPEQTYGMIQQ